MVIESKLMLEVKAILKGFGDKYFDGDKLKKHKVTEDLNAYDEGLIQSLLNNETINRDFVISVNGKEIFKLNEFIDMFQYKEFWQDSYTNYANKIGLTVGGKFIDECEDVVLDFPYKDTILKAGMTKEDKQKEDLSPNEMFLNETIAKDEIDVLFDKKIFKNVKKYSAEGVQPLSEFKEDDNLIIKGNNLIALHSLMDKYAGKIKLIYIDPPYNTGSDSFLYNDKYNHSSWLTFMKNRLEVAKDLLAKNGSIFVHLDKNEVHYLAVLMDEIFGRKNYVETITVVNNPRGRDYGGIANVNEFILVYKATEETTLNLITNLDKKFKYHDELGGFDVLELRNRNSAFHKQNRPNLHYPIYIDPNSEDKDGFYNISLKPSDQYSIELYPRKSQQGIELVWRWGQELVSKNANVNAVAKKNSDGTYSFMQKYRKNKTMARSLWQGTDYNSFEKGTNHLKELFHGKKIFSFSKPESTLKTVIEVGSNPGDIVLDFFMGSGTTAAAALKMNRNFIGIEQMDYINTVSVPRLQKVIEGEQGGISKDVNWQGGGSFVYAELFEKNTGFIKDILNAETIDDLKKVYNIMLEVGDLDFRAYLSKIDWTMSFEDNQKLLVKIIDKNQLYFNYSEIDDSEVSGWLTDEEIAFNKNFYKDLEG